MRDQKKKSPLASLLNQTLSSSVQESFDGLSSLKQLMLDRNRVEEIQPGAFSQLGFLNLLSLTHNQLVYIPNMAFQVKPPAKNSEVMVLKELQKSLLVSEHLSNRRRLLPPGLAEHQMASSQSQLSELPGHRGLRWSVHAHTSQSGPQRAAVLPQRDHDQVGYLAPLPLFRLSVLMNKFYCFYKNKLLLWVIIAFDWLP